MSIVSHKLRTPLTVIKEGVEILEEDILGPLNPKQKRVVKNTWNQTKKLLSLITSLLSFTSLEANLITGGIDKKNHDLKGLILSVINKEKERLNEKKMLVTTKFSEESFDVVCDKEKLILAMNHIIANAIDFNDEGTQITISCHQDDGKIKLSLSDDGIGIPKPFLKHVFENFSQLDTDFTGQIQGMGLGLFVVRRIIKAHEGEIVCQSELGKGTTFIITLPLS
jgi:two-component system, NtrC family, sensor histidine kinase KinB